MFTIKYLIIQFLFECGIWLEIKNGKTNKNMKEILPNTRFQIPNTIFVFILIAGFFLFVSPSDAQAANKDLSVALGVQGIVQNADKISFTFEVTECIRGQGSYDGFECLEYQTHTITRDIDNCFGGDPNP